MELCDNRGLVILPVFVENIGKSNLSDSFQTSKHLKAP